MTGKAVKSQAMDYIRYFDFNKNKTGFSKKYLSKESTDSSKKIKIKKSV